ncbi:acetyl-CoA carboxylase 1-like [Dorcoceras hygrometricum]|uniref:Acetyl-CoA carboxylase 1-like n=1 Tax=Dorcoceras hygrometricum TaxID=472368 RepID=A0A2Z6ZTZ4_9LAMI|nr:acetyl-CoA carboxylase 1-like [Dorcoceras hygrometricum]
MDRTVFRSVQIAQNTVSVAPIVQMTNEPSSFESSSDDILMDFVGHDTTAATSHSPPTISADVQNVLAQLRASVDLLQFELLEHKDDVKKIRETLSLHINNLERTLSDRFDAHDRTYRVLFNNVRHDMRDHKNLLSLDLKSYQQEVSIQVGAAALDTVDV